MIGKLIATATLSGALALGAVGIASAATTTGGTGTTTHTPKLCAKAPTALARLQKLDARYQAWLPKAEARETAAKQAKHTKVATRIERRITVAGKAYNKGVAAAKKIEAKCPGAVATGGTTAS